MKPTVYGRSKTGNHRGIGAEGHKGFVLITHYLTEWQQQGADRPYGNIMLTVDAALELALQIVSTAKLLENRGKRGQLT